MSLKNKIQEKIQSLQGVIEKKQKQRKEKNERWREYMREHMRMKRSKDEISH